MDRRSFLFLAGAAGAWLRGGGAPRAEGGASPRDDLFAPLAPPALPAPDKFPISPVTVPLRTETLDKAWGASRGQAPTLIFWEARNDPPFDRTREIAGEIRAAGKVASMGGLQRWQWTWQAALEGKGEYANPAFAAWVAWIEARPSYLGRDPQGRLQYGGDGGGYVSPAVPLAPEDYPAHYEGERAYYADWWADRLGRLAGQTTTQGVKMSDFYDSHPHTSVLSFFNERMLADFQRRTGIALEGDTFVDQVADIRRNFNRKNYRQEWTDYFAERWAYGWKALAREVKRHTGEELVLLNQTSFYPARMRRSAVDARVVTAKGLAENVTYGVQTLQPFSMKGNFSPPSRSSGMIGVFGAREPRAHYAGWLPGREENFEETVDALWPALAPAVREELGWKYLKRAWLEAGFTHAATRSGACRRVVESLQPHYHSRGEIRPAWLEAIRAVYPVRPFGPALYYSRAIEQAWEDSHVNNDRGYLLADTWGQESEVMLRARGVPFGCYVSDVALGGVASQPAARQPSAWVIPDRFMDGVDTLPPAERRRLEVVAPILTEEEALDLRTGPLWLEAVEEGRQAVGYGFFDADGRLVLVLGDKISEQPALTKRDRSAASYEGLGDTTVRVHLALPDGDYAARGLLSDTRSRFSSTDARATLGVSLARWDTKVLAITPLSTTHG